MADGRKGLLLYLLFLTCSHINFCDRIYRLARLSDDVNCLRIQVSSYVSTWASSNAPGASQLDLSRSAPGPAPVSGPVKLSKSKRLRMKRQAKKVEASIEEHLRLADDEMRSRDFHNAIELYDKVLFCSFSL